MDDSKSEADTVAIQGDRIVWVGYGYDRKKPGSDKFTEIDCQGKTLVPGFIDSHFHLMAYASSLLSVDCGPTQVSSIEDIQELLRCRASQKPSGEWIRGVGYDEFSLRGRRHPTRWDLDEAVPNHPVRLDHRSNHACVLNSFALTKLGISNDTPEPVGALIERDCNSGDLTGLLIEMEEYLSDIIPPLDKIEIHKGIHLAGQNLISMGITSIQDATHTNSIETWKTLGGIKRAGRLDSRITMMVGAHHTREILDRGLGFGYGNSHLNIGAVKIMLTMTTGSLHPSADELSNIVNLSRKAGFQVAIHAVEAEAVEAAVDAMVAPNSQLSDTCMPTRDRIEHCSECSPAVLSRLIGSGVVVVTQPGFIYHNGDRYLRDVATDRLPWLYPIRSIQTTGLSIAASSDAPVTDPNPFVGIHALVTRSSKSGELVGKRECISPREALRMYTLGSAYAACQEGDKGSIEVGKLADLALLDQDPTVVDPENLGCIKTTMTVIGGKVVWEA